MATAIATTTTTTITRPRPPLLLQRQFNSNQHVVMYADVDESLVRIKTFIIQLTQLFTIRVSKGLGYKWTISCFSFDNINCKARFQMQLCRYGTSSANMHVVEIGELYSTPLCRQFLLARYHMHFYEPDNPTLGSFVLDQLAEEEMPLRKRNKVMCNV